LQIKSTNSDVLYHINPNKDWQTHFNFSIALRVDRFYVQSINRKLPPSSTFTRKSRRNVCATQTWVKMGHAEQSRIITPPYPPIGEEPRRCRTGQTHEHINLRPVKAVRRD